MKIPILMDHKEFDAVPRGSVEKQVLFASSPAYSETLEYIVAVMRVVWESHPSCRLIVSGWPRGASLQLCKRSTGNSGPT